jgi:serine/threonine protein kinase
MTPERWAEVYSLFNEALEQPRSRVEDFLRAACKGDASLYDEVVRLLGERNSTGPLDFAPDAAVLPVFETGQIVAGRYKILRYVGRGGMGEVYEARDLDLEKEMAETIALKTLLPTIASDEAVISRFKREIALCRKINHPNVCNVFDLSRHENPDGPPVLFLTMEFLNGENLELYLRRNGAMKETEALPLLRQMAAALDASHEAGVVHRDFKPSNVMLVPNGKSQRAVVTDFGLARQFRTPAGQTAEASAIIAGTVDYMAPELFKGARASVSSDVYALAMTAYRMVTAELPFASETPMGAAIMRCHQPVPSPRTVVPGLSPAWERAILKALDVDGATRFAGAASFIDALESKAAVAPPVARRRRIRPAYAIAAGVGVLSLCGAAAAWHGWRDSGLRLPEAAQALYEKGRDDISAGNYLAAMRILDEAEKAAPKAPQIHARLAEAWAGLDAPEKAASEMALARGQDTAPLSSADRLEIEAVDLSIGQEYSAAAGKYEQITHLNYGDARVHVDIGRMYENAGRSIDAIRSYVRAAEGAQHSPAAWLRLGALHARTADPDKGKQELAEADRLYQSTGDPEGLTEAIVQRGIAANKAGQLGDGAAFLQRALTIARSQSNFQEEISATLRLSRNAYLAGDAGSADRYVREALDIARLHHFDALAVRGLIDVGTAFLRQRDHTDSETRSRDASLSEKYYRAALDLARPQAPHLVALSLLSLATLHDDTNQPEEAGREALEALPFYQANHYSKEALQCLRILSRAQGDTGDYEEALTSFRSLVNRAEGGQDREQISAAHADLGLMLFDLGRYPEALDEFKKRLEFAADAEHVGHANLNCANTLWRLGNYPEAEAAFERAAAVAKTALGVRIQLACGRAAMALSQNQYRKAKELAEEGLSHVGDRIPLIKDQFEGVIGLALAAQGREKEGLARCASVRAALAGGNNVAALLAAELALLEVQAGMGDSTAALRLFAQMRPRLKQYPEMEWRAFALASRFDKQYVPKAQDGLRNLWRVWGNYAYSTYLTRPDVEKLSAALPRQ